MRRLIALLAFMLLPGSGLVFAGGSLPRLLPTASHFRLTLREEAVSKLPLGESCAGEAQFTLTCRAFTLTLENRSTKTVRLSRVSCREPAITIEKELYSSSAWWPVSQPTDSTCTDPKWTQVRLRPGERTRYSMRLKSPTRWTEAFTPGSYTLRASWNLVGCTERSAGAECLAPLQHPFKAGFWVANVGNQESVTVVSNQITVEAPALTDLGTVKFSFTMDKLAGLSGDSKSNVLPAECAAKVNQNLACTIFHYVIRNLSDRPVRSATMTCGEWGNITPEYRVGSDAWKPVPQTPWTCTANFKIETPMLPGKSIEGDFTLAPGFDTGSLPAAEEYQLRFTFRPHACIASPDASFCLSWPEKEEPVLSNEVVVRFEHAPASAGPER